MNYGRLTTDVSRIRVNLSGRALRGHYWFCASAISHHRGRVLPDLSAWRRLCRYELPPRYTGRAVLVIDAHKAQLFQNEAPLSNLPRHLTAVDTQIEILNSDSIASSAIDELHLNEDPEFISPRAGVIGSLVGFANGAVNSVLSVFMPSTANEPAAAPDELLAQRALGTFHSRLKVRRVGLTYAIEIDFEFFNPDRAAQVANAVVDAYAVDLLETKYQVTKRASVWLQDRLKELREELTNAERAVVDTKTKNNIVDTGGRLMNEQQLAEYNSELIQGARPDR